MQLRKFDEDLISETESVPSLSDSNQNEASDNNKVSANIYDSTNVHFGDDSHYHAPVKFYVDVMKIKLSNGKTLQNLFTDYSKK